MRARRRATRAMPWTRGSLLGEGGYGRVFECLNDDGHICAAKVVPLRPGEDDRSRAAQAEIEKEVEVMRKRYSALSNWLVHLMVEKRGGPAAPVPAAAGP